MQYSGTLKNQTMQMKLNESFNAFDRIPPYYIVRNFLGRDLIERLLTYAKAHESEFTPAKVVSENTQKLNTATRVSRVLWDLGELNAEINARFKAVMPQAVLALKLSPFELARCEMELVAHQDGAFFKRHIDTRTGTPDQKSQRIMTGVLYFYASPKSFSGGQLRLYPLSPEAEGFADVEPECDRLVLFPAWAPHEVLPISCPSGLFEHSRFAINCWYRRPTPAHSAG
jgi:SM-20-related protein